MTWSAKLCEEPVKSHYVNYNSSLIEETYRKDGLKILQDIPFSVTEMVTHEIFIDWEGQEVINRL